MRFLLAAALALPMAATARPMVPADLNLLVDVSDPAVSPNGEDIAYVATITNTAADKHESHIWLAHWNGDKESRLTFRAGESETHPRFTADGKYLLFLSSRADPRGAVQVWRLPMAGGEAERITDMPGGISDFAVAPDGRQVAVVAMDAPPAEMAPRPIVIDRYRFKQDGVGYLTNRHQRIYLLSIAERKPVRLTTGDFDEYTPVFSPDSKTLVFAGKRQSDPDRSDNFNLYAMDAHPGTPVRTLTDWPGDNADPAWNSPPAFSPDGRRVAFLQGGDAKLLAYGVRRLAIVPVVGGKVELTEPPLDRNIMQPVWSADGKQINALFEDDGVVRLMYFDMVRGIPVAVSQDRGVITSYAQGGGHIAVVGTTPMHPAEIFAQEGPWQRRLTMHNHDLVTALDFGAVQATNFRGKDGTELHGFAVTPPGAAVGAKLPSIVVLHDGPQREFQAEFHADWQILAGRGYQVIAVNPRGSIGRGEDFATAIYADWGNKDVDDVLAAVNDALGHHNADAARLGIGGWGYGGLLAEAVVARDKRFQAAISGAAPANLLADYGTDGNIRSYETEFGAPWANPAAWQAASANFLHNDRITTPTLFLCGTEDLAVPCANSEQMYQALRSRQVPAALVIYPGASHDLSRPSFLVDRMQRSLDWYGRYLPQTSPAPATH